MNATEETDDLDRDPFEELASEFSQRFRNGELPSIEEYAIAHPDLADEIRELFPTIAAMERSKVRASAPAKPSLDALPIEQLGDFRLLGEIGRGGMGIVYEAEQVSLARHVAVKVLPQQALLDERHLKRFEREAQTAAKLHHTNIVPVFGVGHQDGFHYIVMQFIPGVGLDEVLLALRRQVVQSEADLPGLGDTSSSRISHANFNAQALLRGEFGELSAAKLSSSFVRESSAMVTQTLITNRSDISPAEKTSDFTVVDEGGPSSCDSQSKNEVSYLANLGDEFYRSVARIGEQVADALAYAHEQGTLHRDIKPGNLLLDSTGTVWVADFGLAKFAEQDNVSRTGDIVGTLSYIPPESFSGATDLRGDIYSLGLSLFELLTLRPAFFGSDRSRLVRDITEGNLPRLAKLNPNIPRDLETIVLKAIAHRPEDRYLTARDFANDLECFLGDRPIKARRMSVPEQFARWYRKNKLVAALSAAVLSLLVMLTVLFGLSSFFAKQAAIQLGEERDNAEKMAQVAKNEQEKSRFVADVSLSAVISIFDGFAPRPLPISANAAVDGSAGVASQQIDSSDRASQPAVLVSQPPIKQNTAATLEVLLESLDTLSNAAGNNADFAATFADLKLRVGSLHKALGDTERAQESLDDAILRYEELMLESDSIAHVIGRAVGLNEKGELLGNTNNIKGAREAFYASLKMLEKREDIDESPRAQYEMARTLFLISVQRQQQVGREEDSSPGHFFKMVGIGGNLRKAIRVLEPLVRSETNSEYRYLLARCYLALSVVVSPHDRDQLVAKANAGLAELVQEQPGIDDYKYEFALAKLRRGVTTVSIDEKLQLNEQAVELLSEICSTSPDVFNYQIARSRALGTYTEALDRDAVELAKANNQFLSYLQRNKATEFAEETTEAYFSLRDRFSGLYLDRLPDTHLVTVTEVLAKGDEESALPLFQSIADFDDSFLSRMRAQLGLAILFKANLRLSEAYSMLQSLNERLRDRCELEIKRWNPRRSERFFECFALLCVAEYEQFGDASMEAVIQTLREKHNAVLKSQPQEGVRKVYRAEFDLELAEIYDRLELWDKAARLRTEHRKILEGVLDDSQQKRDAKFQAVRILMNLYRQVGDVLAAEALRERLPKRRPRKLDQQESRDGSSTVRDGRSSDASE